MPCEYYTPGERVSMLHSEVTDLTAMLCAALARLEEMQGSVPVNCDAWWKKHQVEDEKRRAAEQRCRDESLERTRALSKLTDAEREVLGL